MPGKYYEQLLEIATDQFGFVTVAQAQRAGVGKDTLGQMARRGKVERISHGVYRIPSVPVTQWDPYMAAVLWPRGDQAVLSHDTALALHELSDANPAKLHLTLPKRHRVVRAVPRMYVVHHANLTLKEITNIEGVPVTTPERTIRDCYAAHLGPALIRQAIDDAVRHGYLARDVADTLRRDLLQETMPDATTPVGTPIPRSLASSNS